VDKEQSSDKLSSVNCRVQVHAELHGGLHTYIPVINGCANIMANTHKSSWAMSIKLHLCTECAPAAAAANSGMAG